MRKIRTVDRRPPRGQDDADAGTKLARARRERKTIERARHLYIREDDADLRVCGEDPERFGGVASLENRETGVREDIRTDRADTRIVVDDEDEWGGVLVLLFHAPQMDCI